MLYQAELHPEEGGDHKKRPIKPREKGVTGNPLSLRDTPPPFNVPVAGDVL
jgi:hypothetical protein